MSQIYNAIVNNNGIDGNRSYFLKPFNITEFFEEYQRIKVPKYQRPYSWGKSNWNDLWNDICNIIELGDSTPWFFGSVYLVKNGDSKEAELLDGQQRITTLVILFNEFLYALNQHDFNVYTEISGEQVSNIKEQLRDVLCSIGKDENKMRVYVPRFASETEVEKLFIEYTSVNCSYNKYTPNEQAEKIKTIQEDFIRKYKRKGIVSLYRINEAINFFRTKINFVLKDKNQYQAKNFIEYILTLLNNFWLIHVPLNSMNTSIQIFESINNRGLGLSLSDKIKFRMIQKIDTSSLNVESKQEAEDSISDKWYTIFKHLDYLIDCNYLKSDADFFKLYTISKSGNSQLNKDDKIVEFIFQEIDDINDIHLFVDEVLYVLQVCEYIYRRDSNYYNQFSSHLIDSDIFDAMNELLIKGLRVSDNARFLLINNIISNKKTLDPITFASNIWTTVKVIFQEVLSDEKSNSVRTRYLKYSRDNTFNGLLVENEVLLKKTNHLSNVLFQKSNENRVAEFILYFSSFVKQTGSIFNNKDHNNSELEHFIPQKWSTYWQDISYNESDKSKAINEFEEKYISEIKSDRFRTALINSLEENLEILTEDSKTTNTIIDLIGNKLSILDSGNKKMGNRSFDNKINKLKNSKRTIIPPFDDYKLGLQYYKNNAPIDLFNVLVRSLNIVQSCLDSLAIEFDKLNSECNME